ncbi:hypothetical protein CHU98_g1890 [Xylaria longipes]|nr:hypothetical protein CHU98_g1890 [Xylaria longipes]
MSTSGPVGPRPINVNGTKELHATCNESIAAYLPELADADSPISWEDITLGYLASHLAGIPPNYGFSEYYYLKDYFESLGFPHIGDDAYVPCGTIALNGDCTREQFLKGMLESYPVARPAERPVYVLEYSLHVAEARTGKNYTELLETDDTPGGGLVSSLSSLSVFVHGMLDRSKFDSDTAAREWLNPVSTTGSLNSLVGTPWEIFRTSNLTPDHPHVVDIYANGAVDRGYAGTFVDSSTCSCCPALPAANESVSINVTIAQDDSLVLQSIERNDTDTLASLKDIWAATIGGSEPVDRIVFVLDAESGEVVGLEIPYLRSRVLQPVKTL